MKVVINTCYGGFSVSPKATARIAELRGSPCYFFDQTYHKGKYTYTPINGIPKNGWHNYVAFSVSDPAEIDYGKNHVDVHYEENRHDPILVQVVEELGDEASGACAKLKIIEIPDGVDYIVDEYIGMEHIAEKHRTWC